jgi:hypothetical protein
MVLIEKGNPFSSINKDIILSRQKYIYYKKILERVTHEKIYIWGKAK